jgi:peptidyl-dipeptidase Dcp
VTNPFFETWDTPPFSRIRPEHYKPAYERALADHNAEIAAITANPEPAGFENTVAALEKSGKLLSRVEAVFSNLVSADSSDELQAIEMEMAPMLAKHWNDIYLNAALFARVDAVFARRNDLALNTEQQRVLERYHLDFVRSGAKLKGDARNRLAAITEELATIGTQFAQNVQADEQSVVFGLSEDEIAGLPDFARDAAAALAKELKLSAPYAVNTGRSSAETFLQFADRRDMREKVFKAWIERGANANANNNTGLIAETIRLRNERAKLLGYENFAWYKLDDTMAKTPADARRLLEKVWQPALARAREERAALQELISQEGNNFPLAGWDWRYYSEKLRKARYDIDEAEIQPYLQLENIIEAAFATAAHLFGLSFHARNDIDVYHPDVRVWEIRRGDEHIGLFFGDYFARPSKRSGAWMSAFRDQENMGSAVSPVIVNVCNFPKGDPALLSFDDARTLFHEFCHAMHGLLSKVHYPRIAGTNVARDFVELPSQIFEHWLEQPEILERYALHYQTGTPMPRALLNKLIAARNFNQGFATVEFLGSAIFDLDIHEAADPRNIDAAALEAQTKSRTGMPDEIPMRHRPSHFLHVFSGDGYSAGYYSYLWAEVLDADGFKAFKESGNIFDPGLAQRLETYVYAAGGTRDFAEAYRLFRGRDPRIEALLEGRGLIAA